SLEKEGSLKEMVRVARKKVILAVPTGKKSLNSHRRLKQHLERFYPEKKQHYLDEHLEYGHLSKKQILKLIKKVAPEARVSWEKNANLVLWLWFQKVYLKIPRLYHLLRYRRVWLYLLWSLWPLFNFGACLRTIFYIQL
ncbi:hypothetical protein ACFLZP_02480, partial [Patescibacteria group bacterium]